MEKGLICHRRKWINLTLNKMAVFKKDEEKEAIRTALTTYLASKKTTLF